MLHHFRKRPIIKSEREAELDRLIKEERREPWSAPTIAILALIIFFLINPMFEWLEFPYFYIAYGFFAGIAVGGFWQERYLDVKVSWRRRLNLQWQKYNDKYNSE